MTFTVIEEKKPEQNDLITDINNSADAYKDNILQTKNENARELLEYSTSLYKTDPYEYSEFARANKLMNALNSIPLPKIERTGFSFSTPFDHKLKTETRMILDDICGMIGYKEKKDAPYREKMNDFTESVFSYLNDEKPMRTWKTLWIVKKPAEEEKNELIALLCELYIYTQYHNEKDAVDIRETVENIINRIPEESKTGINCRS